MTKNAIVDVGTNSIKFYIAERAEDGTIKTILDENNIARLGEGLRETGRISKEAMKRNCNAISDFVETAKEYKVDKIFGVGTMALRTAENSQDFVDMVKETTGVKIKVISGEEEARLSYFAVLSGLNFKKDDIVVFDTGGGSTEFIFGEGDLIKRKLSINLGSVDLTENILKSDPVTDEEIKKTLKTINEILEKNDINAQDIALVGMGGTVTSMGAVMFAMKEYDPDKIQGAKLTLKELDSQVAEYSAKTIEERKGITGLQPKRADVILAGACIVKAIMQRFGENSLRISDRGLRHGLMYDLFKK